MIQNIVYINTSLKIDNIDNYKYDTDIIVTLEGVNEKSEIIKLNVDEIKKTINYKK